MSAEPLRSTASESDALLRAAAQLLCARLGWTLSDPLQKRLPQAAAEAALGLGLSTKELLDRLHEPACFQALVDRCTIGETYFFRHREQLEGALSEVRRVFPKEPLRIWSAACAGGEEVYSLSFLLHLHRHPTENRIILGTDVSTASIAQARAGRYRRWSLRGVPENWLPQVFEARTDPEVVSVRPELRERVEFYPHNLLDPLPFPKVHLILCRNALLYLQREPARVALAHLCDALVPGGLLVLGVADLPLARDLNLPVFEKDGLTLFHNVPHPPKRASQPVARTLKAIPRASPVRAVLPAPRPPPPPAPTPPQEAAGSLFEQARDAARNGNFDAARTLAEQAAAELLPEAHLLLASLAESVGTLEEALRQTRRALYLDPHLATAHAAQLSLFLRLGRAKDARRARANALRELEGVDALTPLRGVEPLTAGALRRALEPSSS